MTVKRKTPSVRLKNIFKWILFAFLVIIPLSIYFPWKHQNKISTNNTLTKVLQNMPFIPSPTPYQFPYKNPVIPKNQSYRIVVIGDSMTEWLGLNANDLRLKLIKYYPNSEFVTYNYGYSGTNVLTLPDRLIQRTTNRETQNNPILDQDVDLIIIESFGYNPLSEYSLEEGLKKQNEVLEKSVRLILSRRPNTSLAFMTPIAPDPINYARGSRDLSQEVRKYWVVERVAYIRNHQKFAESLGIPVIDVYSLSLTKNGTVNRVYISEDNIHPSKAGVELISQAIADYIYNNKIFPE